MKQKSPIVDVSSKMKILIEAELSFGFEYKKIFAFYEPKIGVIDMTSFDYPIDQFKNFEILKIEDNKIKIQHVDTIFILDFKTSRTFGEIVKRLENKETKYGCMQITLSIQ